MPSPLAQELDRRNLLSMPTTDVRGGQVLYLIYRKTGRRGDASKFRARIDQSLYLFSASSPATYGRAVGIAVKVKRRVSGMPVAVFLEKSRSFSVRETASSRSHYALKYVLPGDLSPSARGLDNLNVATAQAAQARAAKPDLSDLAGRVAGFVPKFIGETFKNVRGVVLLAVVGLGIFYLGPLLGRKR